MNTSIPVGLAGLSPPFYPRAAPRVEGPSHFRRQLAVAERLVPAQAFRCRSALLLWCGDASALVQAEEALRCSWPLDEVHRLRCPIRSWSEALDRPLDTASWLERFVMREVHQREPTLLAVLAASTARGGRDEPSAARFAELLRSWGVAAPLAVIRTASGGAVQCLPAPEL